MSKLDNKIVELATKLASDQLEDWWLENHENLSNMTKPNLLKDSIEYTSQAQKDFDTYYNYYYGIIVKIMK